MNYGADAADQIVKYSLDGLDHSLRLSGTLAKNLAIFFAAVLKDEKKTHGKTRLARMLREGKSYKFFTIPSDRLKEFAREGKQRGLLYVVIRDKNHPEQCELMVFAEDAAKVNRVMDKMNLDFLKSECAEAVQEVLTEQAKEEPLQTETVEMPEGEVQFELSDLDDTFGFEEPESEPENFMEAQEWQEKNPSGPSLRSNDISGQERCDSDKKPSVKKELEDIKKEQEIRSRKQEHEKSRNRTTGKKKKKRKKGKGR